MMLDYGLFMAEKYGYLDTRESRIQKAVKEFIKYAQNGFDINNNGLQYEILSSCDLLDLTNRERERISYFVEQKI